MALKRVGCTTLSQCGLIIGWVIGVISLFSLVITLIYEYGYVQKLLMTKIDSLQKLRTNSSKNASYESGMNYVDICLENIWKYAILSVIFLIIFIASILLIVGVKERRQYFVLSWIFAMAIFSIYLLVKLAPKFSYSIFILLPVAIVGYLWYIIFSIYVKFAANNNHVDNIDMNNFQGNLDERMCQEIEPSTDITIDQ